MTKEQILNTVEKENIRFIRLQFTDIFGACKNVAVTRSQLNKALDNKCMFDGSSIEGFVRIEESDMYLYPDLDTFMIYPWQSSESKVARIICDVYTPDHKPFEGDPRWILKKVLNEAMELGFQFNVGPECEFFLFQTDDKVNPIVETIDQGSYFELGPIDKGEEARRDICLTLEDMGFEIEASHHECAPGQHEIDFKYSEALHAADNIMTFKLAVKSIANKHKLYATFMPKPLYNEAGSGMHINISLSKNGKNVFWDPSDELGLSTLTKHFIAGITEHIKGMTCIMDPLVNSYKRLVPGYEAPLYIAWSTKNRSPLIRIPSARGESTRIELRNPDPSANPYLTLAVCLAAGLDGIKKKLIPQNPINNNIFDLSEDERERLKIDSIPLSLESAIREMKNDDLVRQTLGNHTFDKYIEYKQNEWNSYRNSITRWEFENYLNRY